MTFDDLMALCRDTKKRVNALTWMLFISNIHLLIVFSSVFYVQIRHTDLHLETLAETLAESQRTRVEVQHLRLLYDLEHADKLRPPVKGEVFRAPDDRFVPDPAQFAVERDDSPIVKWATKDDFSYRK